MLEAFLVFFGAIALGALLGSIKRPETPSKLPNFQITLRSIPLHLYWYSQRQRVLSVLYTSRSGALYDLELTPWGASCSPPS